MHFNWQYAQIHEYDFHELLISDFELTMLNKLRGSLSKFDISHKKNLQLLPRYGLYLSCLSHFPEFPDTLIT